VPVVCAGDSCVSGVDLKVVAALVGVAYEERAMLSSAELYAKLDTVLGAACRYMRQVPLEGLAHRSPDRDRTFRDLGFHVMHICAVFLGAYDQPERRGWRGLTANAPDEIRTGPEIAVYGEASRLRLRQWWQSTGSEDPLDRVIETYWGAHTLHEVLERETWHAAQHTRQVMMFLEQLSIAPNGPLTREDLGGLPMPEHVWD